MRRFAHEIIDQEEDEFYCPTCGEVTLTSMEVVGRPACAVCGTTYPCPECGASELDEPDHDSDKPFMCDTCGSVYDESNLGTTAAHEPDLRCPECGWAGKFNEAEVPDASGEYDFIFECPECRNYKLQALSSSRKTARILGNKPCKWCGDPCYYDTPEEQYEDENLSDWGPMCNWDKHEGEIMDEVSDYAQRLNDYYYPRDYGDDHYASQSRRVASSDDEEWDEWCDNCGENTPHANDPEGAVCITCGELAEPWFGGSFRASRKFGTAACHPIPTLAENLRITDWIAPEGGTDAYGDAYDEDQFCEIRDMIDLGDSIAVFTQNGDFLFPKGTEVIVEDGTRHHATRRQAGSMEQDMGAAQPTFDGGGSGGGGAGPGGYIYDVSDYDTYARTYRTITDTPSAEDDSAPTLTARRKQAGWFDDMPSWDDFTRGPVLTGDAVFEWVADYEDVTGRGPACCICDGGIRPTADEIAVQYGLVACTWCIDEFYETRPWDRVSSKKQAAFPTEEHNWRLDTTVGGYFCLDCGKTYWPTEYDDPEDPSTWAVGYCPVASANAYTGRRKKSHVYPEGDDRFESGDYEWGLSEGREDAQNGVPPVFTLVNLDAVRGTPEWDYVEGYVTGYNRWADR